MIRAAFLRAVRSTATPVIRRPAPVLRAIAPSSTICMQKWSTPFSLSQSRSYASGGALSKDQVTGRILDLLKGFDKVNDPEKLSASSHFTNDLGLDSLDTVEVVMAIEEEFSIEIPDKDADAIHSVDQAVEYILGQPDAH